MDLSLQPAIPAAESFYPDLPRYQKIFHGRPLAKFGSPSLETEGAAIHLCYKLGFSA